jgi:hypothetical protein
MKKPCPPATQDKALNSKNRAAAIADPNINYGPINESAEEYFTKAAKHWDKPFEEAIKQKCYNCVAYDVSPRMEDCGGAVKGKTGYCWMHSFSCSGKRSCYTWAKGGAITEDSASYAKQEKNLKENKSMKTFKIFYEETEIESLEALIANPDPSRVKMYGGTAYVDMLKQKLEKAKKAQAIQSHLKKSPIGRIIEDEEVEELKKEELVNRYNDFGIKYKGYHLEVEQDEEPNERYFYYGKLYNPQGKSMQLPERTNRYGGSEGKEDFVTTMGSIKEKEFKDYVDKNIATLDRVKASEGQFSGYSKKEEDAQDRCKRKADQVYGKKTSAYKSGAIVRCRDGKIWKKK